MKKDFYRDFSEDAISTAFIASIEGSKAYIVASMGRNGNITVSVKGGSRYIENIIADMLVKGLPDSDIRANVMKNIVEKVWRRENARRNNHRR